MWVKTQTFNLSDTCILVPQPLTHAKENGGTRRGPRPQTVGKLGKMILKMRQFRLVHFCLFTQKVFNEHL